MKVIINFTSKELLQKWPGHAYFQVSKKVKEPKTLSETVKQLSDKLKEDLPDAQILSCDIKL